MRNGVWTGVVFFCLVVAALGFAASGSLERAKAEFHHALTLALSAPSIDLPDRGNRRSILDDQDDLDADAAASVGPRDTKSMARISGVQPSPRVIFVTRAGPRHSGPIVEPRFLRYGRLLN